MSRIRQNIFWAFAYNTALIPVAAGVLTPFFGVTFKPEYAAIAMAMSSGYRCHSFALAKDIYPRKRGTMR
jgi:Cu+-exporting ATPase